MLLLNIGLARQGKPNYKPEQAVVELDHAGITVHAHVTHNSDTERTVVALVDVPRSYVDERIFSVAVALGQGCIAVYDQLADKGRLVGPRADAWGEFNPEYFLLLNGDRLVTPTKKAA